MTPRLSIFLLGTALLLSGCGLDALLEDGSLRCACPSLNADQWDSCMAPVGSQAVKISVDSSFSTSEAAVISNSVTTWNTSGKASSKRKFFSTQSVSIPSGIRSADPHECADAIGDDTEFYLVREDDASEWSALGFAASGEASSLIPGATVRCTFGAKLQRQIVYINPSLVDSSQLESVIMHELGHTIGLDHSCSGGAGTENFIGCSKVSSDHAYAQALMFPTLSRGSGTKAAETKNSLRTNDFDRTSCLYNGS